MTLDVTDAAAVERLPGLVVERHGRLDIVVSNAGIARDQLADADEARGLGRRAGDEPHRDVHACAQAAMRPMLEAAGRPHHRHQLGGWPDRATRVRSTTPRRRPGLIGFAKALAREVASRGITVNVVAPGMIDTDMTQGDDREGAGRLGRTDSARSPRDAWTMWRPRCAFLRPTRQRILQGTFWP